MYPVIVAMCLGEFVRVLIEAETQNTMLGLS